MYDCKDMLSYKFDYNIIVGGRSNGKTTSVQRDVLLKRFLKKGEQFMRVVRWIEDTQAKRCSNWFTPYALEKLPKGKTIRYYNQAYYYGDKDDKHFFKNAKILGYVINLSKADNYKSNNFEGVTSIIFEEFAPKSVYEYVPDEIDKFNSIISTVNRFRDDVRVYLIGNALSIDNIYFDYFGIDASKLKVGNIYSYSATNEFEHPAVVGLEFVPMVTENENDIPRLLRVSNNLQATRLEQYELPNEVIRSNDWLLTVIDKERFNEFYRVRCILRISIDDTRNLNKNYKYKFVEYAIIEEIANPNKIYIVNVSEKKLDYGIILKTDTNYTRYKLDKDIRNKYRYFDTSYFINKNIIYGDLDIIKLIRREVEL